jgi:hypothetical protein
VLGAARVELGEKSPSVTPAVLVAIARTAHFDDDQG